ncbi:MAG: hypothetical protein L6Q95_04920 [Planctomycetes bacterium]|nr:hypothetical protein [Planctomycetota bacterium]
MSARALLCLAALAGLSAPEAPPDPVRIEVAASEGEIIPQSKGGGGFQRTFRFTAVRGEANRWIRQTLEVRGTVFDASGRSAPAHLHVVEYYRVGSDGRAIQADSHYSQFWDFRGGDLEISSTLEYGALAPKRAGDTITGKSFVLKWAKDAKGELVTMRKRTTLEEIPAERGERAEFRTAEGALPTRYAYRVRWDARPGIGPRTKPAGEIEVGTWHVVLPEEKGPTRAVARPAPIPLR